MSWGKRLGILLVLIVAVPAIAAFFYLYEGPPGKRAFVNGQVLTMDSNNRVAEAVVIDDGRIVTVGSSDDVQPHIDDNTTITDLQGKTLMPGIIDAHGHFPATGMAMLGVDVNSPPIGEIGSIDELLEAVAKKVAATDAGDWVLVVGYDDTMLAEKRHPTRQELDRITTDHPIYVWHISGHMGVANSKALELVGYDESTTDPDGGIIVKDPASGELTGLLEETAAMPVQLQAMNFGFVDFLKMVSYAAGQYASVGVTTSQSASADDGTVEGLSLAAKLKLVPFRQVIFPKFDMLGPMILDGSVDPADYNNDKFNIGAVKITSDGSIQGYTGYLSKPYHVPYKGDAEYRGYPTISREELVETVGKYHQAGMQLAIHANGDAAIDNVIHAFREAQKAQPRDDARLIVIHAQMAREDQLDAMQELGITPSFFPAHTYYWGERHRDIFMGPERAARMSPTRSAMDRGMRFSVHLDPPVVPMQPMLLVWSTVNRMSAGGDVIGEEQRIEPMAALRAVTIDAAWQIFQEDNRGSLEPGKWADMIILSGDPLQNPMAIKDIEVLETIVGGLTIYQKIP
ncbi:MAG: amidohydrolase [Pseudomonadales bacterium]